jgi:DNA polymerase-3 subunit gamma/tau
VSWVAGNLAAALGNMSYLVLARKWRPQTFTEVVGQSHVTLTLQNAIKANRVPHALVFSGLRGVGKTTVARILAKALNCEKGPEPCNHCPLCQDITLGTSMDVYEMDGASNRGIDEIREIREKVKYLPSHGRYKIYIIDEVHMLTKEAFNALLKTLEEPPPHVIFIFATTELHKIPLTIISRCQCYPFRRIDNQFLYKRLKEISLEEKIAIDEEALWLIVRTATGSLRDAISLLDQVVSFSLPPIKGEHVRAILGLFDSQLILKTLEAILKEDVRGAMEIIANIYEQGEDLKGFYHQLVTYWRHLLMVKINSETSLVDLPHYEKKALASLSRDYPLNHLEQLLALLLAEEQTLRLSTQPRFVLEALLIKMVEFKKIVPIELIVEKLKDVSKKEIEPSADLQNPSVEVEKEKDLFEQDLLITEDKVTSEDLSLKQSLRKILKRESPILIPILEKAHLSQDNTAITLTLSRSYANLLSDGELGRIFKKCCALCLGGGKEIIIKTNHEGKQTYKLKNKQEKTKDFDLLKEVLKVFGGEVVSSSGGKNGH